MKEWLALVSRYGKAPIERMDVDFSKLTNIEASLAYQKLIKGE
jgi:hypothetical protein